MNPAQHFLALTPERRARAFEQAASQRAVDAAILEKDFWVCWLLGVVFGEPDVASHLVFKGGTSLSKVFAAIDRFSEDVDLSVAPAFVGADAEAFEALTSRTRRDAAITEMQHLCGAKVQDVIAPRLEAAIQNALGPPAKGSTWLSFELDEQAHSPNLYFDYPASQTNGLGYIRRNVSWSSAR